MEVLKKMKNVKQKRKLLKQLQLILDEHGNLKADQRIDFQTILAAEKLFPGRSYGDVETGCINTKELHRIRKKLEKEFAKLERERRKEELFFDLYQVLDSKGKPKNCTRKLTQKVITEAEALFTGRDFGDADSGFMNVEELFKLYKKLKSWFVKKESKKTKK